MNLIARRPRSVKGPLPKATLKAPAAPPNGESSSQPTNVSADELIWKPIPIWKRVVDVLLSGILIVLLSPILIGIAIYIRLVSPGPAFFKQSRLGEMGRMFTIYKFRTMHVRDPDVATREHRQYVTGVASQQRAVAKPIYEDRLIPGGEFLRSHSLDELPQLFNVLNGSMSLVGPRPEVLEWDDYEVWQLQRFEVTPGMTGLWQVSGKNRLTFQRMVELDIEYAHRRRLSLDLWIMFRTIKVVLSRDNG
ncbi:MAG: sugar transferase [Planctomycetales bacterium]|nr:sugar transferase [Planctomycetales bacterium]